MLKGWWNERLLRTVLYVLYLWNSHIVSENNMVNNISFFEANHKVHWLQIWKKLRVIYSTWLIVDTQTLCFKIKRIEFTSISLIYSTHSTGLWRFPNFADIMPLNLQISRVTCARKRVKYFHYHKKKTILHIGNVIYHGTVKILIYTIFER